MTLKKGINCAGKTIALISGSDLRFYGGGEKDIIQMANNLDGYKILLYSFLSRTDNRMSHEEIEALTEEHVTLIYYHSFEVKYARDSLPFTLSGFRFLFGLKKACAVYSMFHGICFNYILSILSRVLGFKFVFGIHSPIFFDSAPIENTKAKRLFMQTFIRIRVLFIRSLKNIRVQNTEDYNIIKNLGFKGRIYIIPPFIRIFNDEVANKECNDFIVLFVGRLNVFHKGIDLFHDIVVKVMSKNENIKFLVVGSGKDGEGIIRSLQAEYGNNFKWNGFVTEDELNSLYRKASLFVFTSRAETFGMSLAEAQCAGLPAVAFRVKGVEDIILEDVQGKLVQPFDTDSFASEILRYYKLWIEHPDIYEKLRNEISVKLRTRFDLNHISGSLREMFETAIR